MTAPLVLVGTNLGRSGQSAVEAGASWAREENASLVVCAVLPRRSPAVADHTPQHLAQATREGHVRAAAPALVAAQVGRAGPHTGLARVMIREGGACPVLLAAAAELGASVLVVGTQAGAPLSPVVTDVLRSARLPVLLARACSGQGCVVACTDLSHGGLPVVNAASEVACRRGAQLLAVHVVPPRDGVRPADQAFDSLREQLAADQLAVTLRDLALTGRYEVRRGPVVEALLATTAVGADLVVLGRPSTHGPAKHGAVARAVAAAAHAPVLMVPV